MIGRTAAVAKQLKISRYAMLLPIAGATAGIVLAVRGQTTFPKTGDAADGSILALVLGASLTALFLSGSAWSKSRAAPEEAVRTVDGWKLASLRVFLAFMVVGLAIRVYRDADKNSLSTAGCIYWLLAITFLFASLWQYSAAGNRSWLLRVPRVSLQTWVIGVGLLAAVGLVSFFTLFRLGQVPRDMTSDVIVNVIDAEHAKTGRGLIYYPYSDGAVFVYASALISKLAGGPADFLTVKLAGALAAILTVPVTFLLAREAFGNSRLALFAAILVASAHWPVLLARSGYRLTFTPLLAALVFWLLLRAIRSRRRNDHILCGLALGISLYGYIPVRILPLLVIGCLGLSITSKLIGKEKLSGIRRDTLNSLVLFGMAIVVVIPLSRYAIDRPDEYWRAISILGPTANTGPFADTVGKLVANFKEAALMFNWKGDVVWTNNIPYSKALDNVTGILLPIGLGIAMISAAKERRLVPVFLIAALLAMMLPTISAVTNPGDNPSFGRSSGAIPFVFTFSAVAIEAAVVTIERTSPGAVGRLLSLSGVALTLAVIVGTNFSWYFSDYPAVARTHGMNASELATAIKAFGSRGGSTAEAFVVGFPGWLDYRGVGIELDQPDWPNGLGRIEDAERYSNTTEPLLFLLNVNDAKSVSWLEAHYPKGTLQRYASGVGQDHDFLLFQTRPFD